MFLDWRIYLVFYVAAIASGFLLLISDVFNKRREGTRPAFPFNVRCFVSLNLSTLFISAVLLLSLAVGSLGKQYSFRSPVFFVILSISILLVIGLIYSVVKGDLSWTRNFFKRED